MCTGRALGRASGLPVSVGSIGVAPSTDFSTDVTPMTRDAPMKAPKIFKKMVYCLAGSRQVSPGQYFYAIVDLESFE
jgi:hypothetical protein